MPISDLRNSFKERSGDINLTNKEVDNFINTGIKLLDKITEYTHSPAKLYQKITAGTTAMAFTSFCRVLKEVWLIDANTGRVELEKVADTELRTVYANLSTLAAAKPKYYSNSLLRDVPESFDPADPTLTAYAQYIDTVNADYGFRGITIMPKADTEYLIELIGKFNSPVLSDTVTDNWWSINDNELVIQSALYFFELSLRNAEGAKELLTSIRLLTGEISKDTYEEDYANPVIMEG